LSLESPAFRHGEYVNNIEMKKVSYHTLLAMDIEYDKSCVLNKYFSIYTNNKIVGKLCPKGIK